MADVVRVHEEAQAAEGRARAARQPATERVHPVHELQRVVGNRVVGRMLAEQAAEEAPAEVEQAVDAARGGGEPLADEVRAPMETSFGADFGSVRVHQGPAAAGLARQLGARAFATGSDVFFGAGNYDPSHSAGRELLAHELAHVVQQTGPGVQTKLEVGPPGDALELEADRAARAVLQQESLSAQPDDEEQQTAALQRQPELEQEEKEQAR